MRKNMRKNARFAIAATIMGAMMFLAKSNVVVTSADIVRPKIGLSTYVVKPSSYLPIQVIDPIW
jgi:hypothetical protein